MKKIFYIISFLIFSLNIYACTGYKPIFSSSNLVFKIANYEIKENKKLGNKIYSKLYLLSKSNNDNPEAKNIDVLISLKKIKNATAKDSAGKILEYKISLEAEIIIKDFQTKKKILNEIFYSSASYRVQDQHSETIQLENRTIENLINLSYEEFLVKLTDKLK